ncbi:PaaI family thioesterase [Gordonia humi]|uniref:Acyl-coenzyme A thioesterase THEM4 n=1 Tax=Gordonia humi TaxID=686429 RepID=A0A840ELD6_9ACTN|nr:PaaI family thioesterase [Gordonia humi]MBB4133545.1 acyl-coenzyme A thioesterase PaaI-like protein [Gordonia humi]
MSDLLDVDSRPAPESSEDSALAEYVAEVCRRLSAGLLRETGDDLRSVVAAEVRSVQWALEDPAALRDRVPVHPPRLDHRGRVRMFTNPVLSQRNPLAPPLTHVSDGDECEFRVTLPLQYQGPRNMLHGGYVGVLLDDVLWYAVRHASTGISFTRELTVTYERPVPLFEELRIVGRVVEAEGRKTFAEGEIVAGGQVCARATGLWIAPKPRRDGHGSAG